ncbi:MAG TPA: bifunctional [glutamate--ammonia ligase]-adenylyl-L-tyrosine phosphorylase/[glutamate--ammonia-ligase] adenylyltransferase [Candidatus Hydrogenedentes bacterium]|nr:bifunctional [glutamate--ammonia ligase]-adenylyl-L-tyrosine phosphorylase/[glutamate--ammonia-ligase] adenylyltransferase [Candidatus Hydrogenedentota bacterium]HPC18355.1 bifunctional [glutamate--ammonia ligase]-adenylyl-L-tyrosine phosphorylase/[glutamate--ammonia-ligase] adenylyltransferase [Candidatus Hydrogenedentota bacterium]HRT22025.1 bifunctional [glutamate--ammonia ligase]-adenylyl-L-tyrosine phosphorylase/[glutamate--ammonia-ligase] adenylyltransferase [Candidatus Hydrogenedentota 
MNEAFAAIPFADRTAAQQRIAALFAASPAEWEESLAAAMEGASDPDTVLVRLQRFVECHPDPPKEVARMGSEPRYARLMCTLFDQSHFLTDILCRWPEHAAWLFEEADLNTTPSRSALVDDLSAQMAGCESPDQAARILRVFRQREILRIATRDIVARASVASLTEDLSNLADASLETAIRFSTRRLEERFGTPMAGLDGEAARPVSFVVIGMGKLGGRELNFSSDIDLVFVYSEDGQTTGGSEDAISVAEFYQKLGEHIIRLISDPTPDGYVFRVDMRLRPHGRLSPLANSLDSTVYYYGEYAQAWERQALIKARPVAGDMALGERFIEGTRVFAFPRYFDDETLDAIREIKLQMEAQVAGRGETEIEVKLGRGGIRDVEFTVQVLQMLNGGRMPEFRTGNTLEAIRALGVRGLLRPFEVTTLSSNYIFMRQVEHRLQIEGSQQRHVLPNEPAALDRFARRLGYANGASFMADYRERAEATRQVLDRFLTSEGSGHLWTYDLLSPHSDGRVAAERLARYGFKDPVKARAELLGLSVGSRENPYPFHVRRLFAEVVPALLEELSACADPDMTLVRLSQILTNLQAPVAVYTTMKDSPAMCKYLVTLVSNSQYLSEILIRDPGLFDELGTRDDLDAPSTRADLEAQLASLSQAYDSEAAPYRLRDGETMRIGIRELFRNATVADVGRELAQLAEVCLGYALDRARQDVERRYGSSHGAFAILAMGKLGGREMGYGSDLDLIFVYDADATTESGMAASEYFAAVAAHTMRRLKDVTRYGSLYDIDARLRPDGNKGILAVNSRRIVEYYEQDAQAWERLALIKIRAVAGDATLGKAVEERLRDIAFGMVLDAGTLEQIEGIRQKICQNASPLDLKKAEGGLAETEFAVRLLQIQQVARIPEIKRGDVLGALEGLFRFRAITGGEYETLHEAYLLYRRIENRIRLMHGRSDSQLPATPEAQSELAQRLEIDTDLALLVQDHRVRVHQLYLRLLKRAGLR